MTLGGASWAALRCHESVRSHATVPPCTICRPPCPVTGPLRKLRKGACFPPTPEPRRGGLDDLARRRCVSWVGAAGANDRQGVRNLLLRRCDGRAKAGQHAQPTPRFVDTPRQQRRQLWVVRQIQGDEAASLQGRRRAEGVCGGLGPSQQEMADLLAGRQRLEGCSGEGRGLEDLPCPCVRLVMQQSIKRRGHKLARAHASAVRQRRDRVQAPDRGRSSAASTSSMGRHSQRRGHGL